MNLKIAIGILALLIVFYFIITQQTFISSDTRKVYDYYNPTMLIQRFTQTENDVASGSARNLWYPVTARLLESKAYSPLTGFGLGMYASNTAMLLMPSTNLLIYNYFNQEQMGLDAAVDSQIIPIWGEMGYIGLILVYALFFVILFRMIQIYRRSKEAYLKALSSTAIAYTIFFMIGFYVHHLLESQTTSVLLFLFIGVAEKYFRIEKKEASGEHNAINKKVKNGFVSDQRK